MGERKLSLKYRAQMANANQHRFSHNYRLTDVPCTGYCLIKLERPLFESLKGYVEMFSRSVCCQHHLSGGLSILRLRHLQRFLDGKSVRAPLWRVVFQQLVPSLME